MNEIEEETTERLLHNLQVECLLASANCAKGVYYQYKSSWTLATELDVKKNAARVILAMWGKVETIVNGVALEFESVINSSNRSRLEPLQYWLTNEIETTKKAKAFLDRFDSVEASRKKIEAVCDRLGTVKTFFDGRKHEQLVKGDWELVKIREQLENAVSISLELMRLIGKEEK